MLCAGTSDDRRSLISVNPDLGTRCFVVDPQILRCFGRVVGERGEAAAGRTDMARVPSLSKILDRREAFAVEPTPQEPAPGFSFFALFSSFLSFPIPLGS